MIEKFFTWFLRKKGYTVAYGRYPEINIEKPFVYKGNKYSVVNIGFEFDRDCCSINIEDCIRIEAVFRRF